MQPTLQAIQQMNQINTTPIIQAMQSYKINTAPIIKVFQQFKEINMTPMIQAIQMIFDSTKMIQNIIDAFSDQMTKLLKNINYKPFYGYFEDVKNLAKNYDISEQLIIKFLNEHQWFVIDSMPERFYSENTRDDIFPG